MIAEQDVPLDQAAAGPQLEPREPGGMGDEFSNRHRGPVADPQIERKTQCPDAMSLDVRTRDRIDDPVGPGHVRVRGRREPEDHAREGA